MSESLFSSREKRTIASFLGCVPVGVVGPVLEHSAGLSMGATRLIVFPLVAVYVFFAVTWIMLGHFLPWRANREEQHPHLSEVFGDESLNHAGSSKKSDRREA